MVRAQRGPAPVRVLSSRASGALSSKSKPIPGPHLVYGFLTDFAERRLIALRHAALYITELLKTEHDAEWRAATEALVLITKGGGPMVMARIGMMHDAALKSLTRCRRRKSGGGQNRPLCFSGLNYISTRRSRRMMARMSTPGMRVLF